MMPSVTLYCQVTIWLSWFEVLNCQKQFHNFFRIDILGCPLNVFILKNPTLKLFSKCICLSFCWSGHVSSPLWSNVSKVKSLKDRSLKVFEVGVWSGRLEGFESWTANALQWVRTMTKVGLELLGQLKTLWHFDSTPIGPEIVMTCRILCLLWLGHKHLNSCDNSDASGQPTIWRVHQVISTYYKLEQIMWTLRQWALPRSHSTERQIILRWSSFSGEHGATVQFATHRTVSDDRQN